MNIRPLFLIVLLLPLLSAAQTAARFGNEAADTTRITGMLIDAQRLRSANGSTRTAHFARQFVGTPYAAHTLEGPEETLTVRLDSLDCTTFVETALAMAYTVGEGRTSWRDYLYNLRRLRYRGGEIGGYPSRLHYISDWAVDNRHRGNIREITADLPGCSYMVRTIDFMTSHRDSYPALADSANYARMRQVESGYRSHRFPYVKTAALNGKDLKADLRDGDVLAFVSKLRDLDVTHMGLVSKASPTAEPHVLHASMTNGKVEVSVKPLADFVRRNPHWIGVRIFRLEE